MSVNAVMVGLIDHAGHELWSVEKQGGAPKNAAQWKEIEHHAIQLAASGTLIAMGGTGKADPGWAKSPDWRKLCEDLNSAGLEAMTAARSKNLAALIKANGRLVETCERCHKEFKPDLPTEGSVHPHFE
ncbi:MAG: cytochrome c [Acidobacteriota bacterium]